MQWVALGWLYVVLMMSLAEATSTSGSVLGAVFTFVLYGVLPLSIVLYILRKWRIGRAPGHSRPSLAPTPESSRPAMPSADPDAGSHAPGDPVAPERKEP